jgi:ABC-type sugar transport system permease subunit
MTQSTRKLVGTFLTLIGLVVYCGLAISLYSALLTNAATPVQLIYFAVAGLGWALPTGLIIRWMAKPDGT